MSTTSNTPTNTLSGMSERSSSFKENSSGTVLKYKTDLEKSVVINNFENRGWVRTNDGKFCISSYCFIQIKKETDWHIYWASVQTVKQIFNPENVMRLGEHQYVLYLKFGNCKD